MDTTLFLEQFGHLATSAEGVDKLRGLVLDLAVRGKLVEQNPDDGSALELIQILEEKKKTLEQQGQVKKPKKYKSVMQDEIQFRLPKSWKWIEVEAIGEVRGGKRVPKGTSLLDTQTPYIYIRVTDMKNQTILSDKLKYIDAETREVIQRYTISSDDIYITIAGTIGDVGLVPVEFDGMNLTENAAKLSLYALELFDKRFILHCLKSNVVQAQFAEKLNKMAQPKLSLRSIKACLIPLPPLAEQKRIVARVDELMHLCDQLEAELDEQRHLRERAVKSALFHLTGAENKAEALAYWRQAYTHFNALFDHPVTVAELRAAILQLAVQGRLVPQHPDDEPASVLLEQIAAEKQRLYKAGEIKKPKTLPPIAPEEIPYELPVGWEWVQMGELIDLISGRHLKPEEYTETPIEDSIPYITGPAEFGVYQPEEPTKHTLVKNAVSITGDILITVKGAGVGKLNINGFPELAISRQLMAIRPILFEARDYMHFFLMARYELFQLAGIGTTVPGLSRTHVEYLPIPFPPLAEQLKITGKVDELMLLCEQLEAEANHTGALASRLTDSVIYHLLNGHVNG